LTFLKPDILRAASSLGGTSQRHDSGPRSSPPASQPLRDRSGTLQTSASDYGLADRPRSMNSSRSSSSGRRHRNPYLETSPPGLNR
jgi:hypothetical protein